MFSTFNRKPKSPAQPTPITKNVTPTEFLNACRDYSSKSEVVQKYIQQGGDINYAYPNDGCTALMHAAENGDVEIAKVLLAQPSILVNAKNKAGETALMYATHTRYPRSESGPLIYDLGAPVVELLLLHKDIDINAVDDKGHTALYSACNGHKKIITRLLNAPGIDVNVPNHRGGTCLSMMAQSKDTDILVQLLESPNINVNCVDKYGMTPLMRAVFCHSLEAVIVLLSKNADIHWKNDDGKSAVDYAESVPMQTLLRLISDKVPMSSPVFKK